MDRESLLISFFLKVNPTRTNSKTTDGSEAGFKLSSVYNKLNEGNKMGLETGNWITLKIRIEVRRLQLWQP